jgi:CDP-diacylglycerol--glycerol-3-phosphate 3-phosphatidyltransferase
MSVTAEEKAGSKVFNVPNQLTAARFVLSIAVFALIPLQYYMAAMIVFIIAASTDWIDGWYARKFGQVTKLGRIFDPFVDKIIICGTFTLLAVEMRDFPWYIAITGWMAVIVVGRELLVTALRSIIEGGGGDFSAKMAGKLKMVFQCVAVVAALIALRQVGRDQADDLQPWLKWTLAISVWVAVVSTVHSGVGYVLAAWKHVID